MENIIEYARKDGMDAKDYHILFPIPQKALNENSNFKNRNPGYEKLILMWGREKFLICSSLYFYKFIVSVKTP